MRGWDKFVGYVGMCLFGGRCCSVQVRINHHKLLKDVFIGFRQQVQRIDLEVLKMF